MDKPRLTIRMPHHLGIAVEPDGPAIPCDHTIGGAQRLAGEKHLGGFQTPAPLILRMDVLIPANRIFQPFFARITERCLDLGAYIGLTDAAIEISHEHDRWNLLEQRAILRLEIR